MEKMIIADYEQIHENFDAFLSGEKKGVIELAVNVANINEWHSPSPDRYSDVLGLEGNQLEKILYYASKVVKDPKGTDLKVGDIVKMTTPDAAEYVWGMDAVEFLISRLDLKNIIIKLRSEEISLRQRLEKLREEEEAEEEPEESELIEEDEESEVESHEVNEYDFYLSKLRKICQKLDSARYIQINGVNKIKISTVSLFPLEIRTILSGMQREQPYAVMDELCSMYVSIALRSNRLKTLQKMEAPEIILVNEGRMLQECVDRLICNGKRGKPYCRNMITYDEKAREEMNYISPSLTDLILRSMKIV